MVKYLKYGVLDIIRKMKRYGNDNGFWENDEIERKLSSVDGDSPSIVGRGLDKRTSRRGFFGRVKKGIFDEDDEDNEFSEYESGRDSKKRFSRRGVLEVGIGITALALGFGFRDKIMDFIGMAYAKARINFGYSNNVGFNKSNPVIGRLVNETYLRWEEFQELSETWNPEYSDFLKESPMIEGNWTLEKRPLPDERIKNPPHAYILKIDRFNFENIEGSTWEEFQNKYINSDSLPVPDGKRLEIFVIDSILKNPEKESAVTNLRKRIKKGLEDNNGILYLAIDPTNLYRGTWVDTTQHPDVIGKETKRASRASDKIIILGEGSNMKYTWNYITKEMGKF